MQTITVKVNKRLHGGTEQRHAEFPFEFPSSVAEALEHYGETLTLKLIHDAITSLVQAPARKALEGASMGLSTEEYSHHVTEAMRTFKVEMRRARRSTQSKESIYQTVAEELANPEKSAELLEKFRRLGINLELSPSGAEGLRRR